MQECHYHRCKKLFTPTGVERFCSKNCQNCFSVSKRRMKTKIMAIQYLGNCCTVCGYDKTIAAMEFHHLDPTKKDFTLSSDGHTRSWERIKSELDKCILVCANCHREIHYGIRENQYITNEILTEL